MSQSCSFSDRYPTILKVAAAIYKAGPPPNISYGDAQKLATDIETRIMGDSADLADYQSRCTTLIQELDSSVAKVTNPDDKETNNNRVAQVIDKRRTAFKWGRYEWAVHVNQGIFSRVFTAKAPEENPDSFPGRPGDCVSLKVTYLAALVAPHNVEREARILRKAAGPNIITLWETFRDGAGHLVLVFPHMSYSLSQLIEQPEYPDAQRQSWLKDMFKGLAHIHSLGIIHRDIKPSNILLESITGPACLIDFGIAWCPGDPASEAPDKKITDVGTASYRPIEVLFGNQSYDTSLDLWAAGCVVAQVTCFSKKNLFTSGELGSELALILSIFKSLGTPSDADFQGVEKLPDWGKLEFNKFPPKAWSDLVPRAPPAARDLISKLVRYSPSERLTAQQALEHPYLAMPLVDQGEEGPLTKVSIYGTWLRSLTAS